MIRPAFGVLASLLASAALAAQPVTLKPAPVDANGSVTLAELFDGTSSSVVVAPGPKAGASVVLDAARVQAVARSAGLSWTNPAGVRRVTVRSAPAASAATAAAAVRPAAVQAGAEALTYVRSLNAGTVITADDLTWAPASRTPGDAPDDAEAAIGLAVRKPVRAGSAVSAADLTAPRVIGKNDAVSVQYRVGGVSLSLQGKALTAAAAGESVRILNLSSKAVIEAVAAGPGLAVVGPQAESLKLRGVAALASR